jgi:hypothetical protein
MRPLNAFLRIVIVVSTALAGGGAEPAAAESEQMARDRALLEAELAFDQSLLSARSAASQLPLPRLDRTPAIDGAIEEPFWEDATLWRWQSLGDSKLRMPFDWSFRAAIAGADLCLAGERAGAPGPRETLSLLSGLRERIVLRLAPGAPLAIFEGGGEAKPIEAIGGAFAASIDAAGLRWELRAPLAGGAWPAPIGALRPLAVCASRGLPGELFVSPEFRLLPARFALRYESVSLADGGEPRLEALLTSREPQPLAVRQSDLRHRELPAGGRLSLSFHGWPAPGEAGVGWDLRAGTYGLRLGLACALEAPLYHPDGVQKALSLAIEHARAAGELGAPLVEEAARLGEGLESMVRLEGRFLEARWLLRRALRARLGGRLDEIAFVKSRPFRDGPFYAHYLHAAPGGAIAAWSFARGEQRDLFAAPEGATLKEMDVSFDGGTVLFSMRRGDAAHLFTVDAAVDAAGGEPRAITEGPHFDVEPAFIAGGRIVFSSTRGGALSPVSPLRSLSLHVVGLDGSGLRRLSANDVADFTPAALPDGRILFLRWVHEDKPGNAINSLWTIYPDGRGLEGFFGLNRAGMAIEPRAFPDGRRIAAIDAGPSGQWRAPMAGAIAVLEGRAGRDEALQRIAPERGGFKHPWPLGEGLFLAAHGWIDSGWALYLVDASGHREIVYRDPERSCLQPVPLAPRPAPRGIPDLSAGDPAAPATLFVQDIYQGLPGVVRGAVARLRVVEVEGRPERGALESRWGFLDQELPMGVFQRQLRRDLGSVPVHADGSVFFEAPPRRNLFFQALDAGGLSIQTMRDTVAFAPGERRSCIGCHEDRRLAPLAGPAATPEALRGPPAKLEPPAGGGAVSFSRDIQPILDRRCLPCHDAAAPAAGVILSGDATPYFSISYETLTRGAPNDNTHYWGDAAPAAAAIDGARASRRALAGAIPYVAAELAPGSAGARASRLFALLDAGHQGARLEDAERRALGRWMDLNLPYYGDWTAARAGAERRRLRGEAEGKLALLMRSRCRGCHPPPELLRGAAVILDRPELSPILRAPLPRAEGGTGQCKKPVFRDRKDAAYLDILEAIEAGAVSASANREG